VSTCGAHALKTLVAKVEVLGSLAQVPITQVLQMRSVVAEQGEA
jgi:hypothetical protein